MASNTIAILNALKESFINEYDTKNLSEIKIVIEWQISRVIAINNIKINQHSSNT